MNLASIVKTDLIFPHIQMENKMDVYEFLLNEMHKSVPQLDTDVCMKGLEEREKLGSMVYPDGVSIPHTRIEGLNQLVVAIATFKKPVIFDGEEVKIVIMIITSPEQSALYLKTVASFAKISSRYEHIFKQMINSTKAQEICELVKMTDLEVETNLLARDIMMPPVTIRKGSTVQEVTDLMKMHHMGFIPVVDDAECYVGEINNLDIIRLSLPEYVFMMEDLSFLLNLEPFQEFLKKEKTMLIDNIIKAQKTVRPNSTMVEVVFIMLKHNMYHLTVAEKDGKVVGVITTKDIVEKILRL
ncbi:MAG TPA: PTS sugar transporter subunit IIA [Candidatus Cloacimonadota bacterium]|nr:PTS sugar transporter subunit IIA [Candidatus Cloacimonadota bacterium]HPT70807.1 PTS sugar transporter subunit IIA [Candidatus Cloacimonadota bacterium]